RLRAGNATDVYAWFYGFGGELLAVYKLEPENGDVNRTWPVLEVEKERVRVLGRMLRMGTLDTVIDRGGSVIRHGTQNLAYYPYGEEQGGATANDRTKFAGNVRDASTGMDYAWNRMYKVEWGRFSTPDPSATGAAKQSSTWNKYAYVEGDPANFHDPEGLQLRKPGWNWEYCGENWLWDASLSGPCRDEGWPGGGGGARMELLPKPKPEPGPGPSLGGVIPLPIVLPIIIPPPEDDSDRFEDDRLRPNHLRIIEGGDCYIIPKSGPVTRQITYRLYNWSGGETSGYTITEHLTGDLPSSGPTLSGPPNSFFEDEHSVLLGKMVQRLTQTFTASNSSLGYADIGVFVRGFKDAEGSPSDYGILGVYKTGLYIKINDDYGGTFSQQGTFVPNRICGR
ncbi:MAG: RHS repeat-associated core domain-containing protein, partial [Bryobacteraceae bacterium]|nr:RHS repeat-associated core domain-containing protein [Bryobacteraceae bacterium]